ncbi:hypothetical protein GOP47_0010912 [Adiantum capillus-veneris]|uniref:PRA1 family protein n=1 Tax=Adiantum capillus-veneris TaxID=13818 RepID=A0A9D4ZJ63_ADICA|nr:hypothetical protein GOP47_0010912 [Adiantum capillus-veneris]
MAGNSTLPIYQNSTTSTSAAPPSSTSYVASAKAFMGEIAEAGKTALARQRPWSEVLDKDCFSKPDSIADATSRMKQNLSYFRFNYAVVSAVIVFIGLLWHPGSLIILMLLAAAWFYLYVSRTEPVVFFGRAFSAREVLVILGVVTFGAVLFTSTGSTILTSLVMAAALLAVHAAFRTPDDLFLEEPVNVTQKNFGYQPLTTV